MQGTVRTLKPGGYGFIQRDDGGDDVFFHVRDLAHGTLEEQLVEGVPVAFTIRQGDKGPMASRVRVVEAAPRPEPGAPGTAECIEGMKQAALALLEWLDLLEQSLKR